MLRIVLCLGLALMPYGLVALAGDTANAQGSARVVPGVENFALVARVNAEKVVPVRAMQADSSVIINYNDKLMLNDMPLPEYEQTADVGESVNPVAIRNPPVYDQPQMQVLVAHTTDVGSVKNPAESKVSVSVKQTDEERHEIALEEGEGSEASQDKIVQPADDATQHQPDAREVKSVETRVQITTPAKVSVLFEPAGCTAKEKRECKAIGPPTLHDYGIGGEVPVAQKVSEILPPKYKDAEHLDLFSFDKDENLIAGAEPLSLAEAIYMALEGNHEIAAASFASAKLKQGISLSKSVYDPVVFAEAMAGSEDALDLDMLTINPDGEMLKVNQAKASAGVRQHLPTGGDIALSFNRDRVESDGFFDKETVDSHVYPKISVSQPLLKGLLDKNNRTEIKVARLNHTNSLCDFKNNVSEKIFEVCQAYWQLVYNYQQVVILEKVVAMAEEVHRREKVRMANGLSQQMYSQRAFAAVESRRISVMRAKHNLVNAVNRLRYLLGGNIQDLMTNKMYLPIDRPLTRYKSIDTRNVLMTAIANRMEIKKAMNSIEINQLIRKKAQWDLLPELNVSAELAVGKGDYHVWSQIIDGYDIRDHNKNSWKLGVSFSYPLGSIKARSNLKAAKAELMRQRALLRNAQTVVINDAKNAIEEVELKKKEMATSFKATRATNYVLQGEQVRFNLGQTTNEELLRTQETLADHQRTYYEAIINYNISLLKLSRAKGTLLEDLGIGIER